MKASALAKKFVSKFLEEGSFVDSGGPVHQKASPAAAMAVVEEAETGFAGLSVQAVGYAEGEPAIEEPDDSEQPLSDEIHI